MPPLDYNPLHLSCPRYRSCLAEKERLAHERREVILSSAQNDPATKLKEISGTNRGEKAKTTL